MKEAYFDLEHSFPPSHSLLEIKQNRIPENPHDCPDILRDHKCPYQLSNRRTRPRGEHSHRVPQTHGPLDTHQRGPYSPLKNDCVNG